MQKTLSEKAYSDALELIPGGVNSPVRALRSVGASPLFIQKARGTVLTDIDNRRYIDFCLSWGVHLHGHAHPAIIGASVAAVKRGSSYGISTTAETQLARMVVDSVPSIEKVRFVSSGTEAVMSAIRLARAYTGRDLILKFDGCYHGHADHLLVAAGSGAAGIRTGGIPGETASTAASTGISNNSASRASSAGVPESFVRHTLSVPFNDPEAVKQVFQELGHQIAAIITEPLPANMGVVPPAPGYLQSLRDICNQYGSVLIFDEVITGFRLGRGGAQELFGVRPDLTTLGKIIGGGFPAAAFGGKAEIMDQLAPLGKVYQAGTLSGNPVAMAAGIQTLQLLQEEDFYTQLEEKSQRFGDSLREIIRGKDIQLNQVGSLFTLFFSATPVTNFAEAAASDTERFARYFRAMLGQGIYLSPSAFEASFISAAHSERQLTKTLQLITNHLSLIT
jgi:glutamate-1-semialdehyde 2,1-aminomutase